MNQLILMLSAACFVFFAWLGPVGHRDLEHGRADGQEGGHAREDCSGGGGRSRHRCV